MVTGANRGIGFEVSRQLAKLGIKVIMTARNENRGKQAYEILKKSVDNIFFYQLDVTNPESIKNIYEFILKEFGKLDILINNAGICIDKDKDIMNVDIETVRKTMETNLYGPLLLCQTFVPLMKKNSYGRIVNVSTGIGQLSGGILQMGLNTPIYRISKTALNALTCILSHEVKGSNILVNSANPGWVKTEMGGPFAERTVEQGAETIVWLATLPDHGPTGKFFQDKKIIEW